MLEDDVGARFAHRLAAGTPDDHAQPGPVLRADELDEERRVVILDHPGACPAVRLLIGERGHGERNRPALGELGRQVLRS
jgi:hypothetical protein